MKNLSTWNQKKRVDPPREDKLTLKETIKRVLVDINRTEHDNFAKRNDTIPVQEFIKLQGVLNGKHVFIVKDDKANTNVVLKLFIQRNKRQLKLEKEESMISH